MKGCVSIGARTAVGAKGVAANLRTRSRMLGTLVHISTQMLVFGIRFETRVALALVTDRLVDADVGAGVDGLAFVDIYSESNQNQNQNQNLQSHGE